MSLRVEILTWMTLIVLTVYALAGNGWAFAGVFVWWLLFGTRRTR